MGTHHEARELNKTQARYWLLQLGSEYIQPFKRNAFLLACGRHFSFMAIELKTNKDGKKIAVETKAPKEKQEDKTWYFRISRRRLFKTWKPLNTTQRTILLSLWLYASKNGICYPSERRLARDLGLAVDTINRNIKILRKKRFIKIEKKVGKHNKYFLLK